MKNNTPYLYFFGVSRSYEENNKNRRFYDVENGEKVLAYEAALKRLSRLPPTSSPPPAHCVACYMLSKLLIRELKM